jgi:hypothetical protein
MKVKILDTKKAKERDEAVAKAERELREYQEWLNSATSLGTNDLNDIQHLWDGQGNSTRSLADIEKLVESLHKQLGLP